MARLIDLLKTLDPDTLLSDGGTDWTADNLIDALRDADEEGAADYVLGSTEDGRTTITRLKPDGYLESIAAYVEVPAAE